MAKTKTATGVTVINNSTIPMSELIKVLGLTGLTDPKSVKKKAPRKRKYNIVKHDGYSSMYYHYDDLVKHMPYSKIEALKSNVIDPIKDKVFFTHKSSIPTLERENYKIVDDLTKADTIVLNGNIIDKIYGNTTKGKLSSNATYVALLERVINDSKYKLVIDKSFMNDALKDRIILDEEIYQNVRSLLLSKNKSDKQTAYGILNACNYEKSMGYLVMIIHEFGYLRNRALVNYFNEIVKQGLHIQKNAYIDVEDYIRNCIVIHKSTFFDQKDKNLITSYFKNEIKKVLLGICDEGQWDNVDIDIDLKIEIKDEKSTDNRN